MGSAEGNPILPLAVSLVELVAHFADEAAASLEVKERAEGREGGGGEAGEAVEDKSINALPAHPSLLYPTFLPVVHTDLPHKGVPDRALPTPPTSQYHLAVKHPYAVILTQLRSKPTVLAPPQRIPHHASRVVFDACAACELEGGFADEAVGVIELYSAVSDSLGEAGCGGGQDIALAACLAGCLRQTVLAVGRTGRGQSQQCHCEKESEHSIIITVWMN